MKRNVIVTEECRFKWATYLLKVYIVHFKPCLNISNFRSLLGIPPIYGPQYFSAIDVMITCKF